MSEDDEARRGALGIEPRRELVGRSGPAGDEGTRARVDEDRPAVAAQEHGIDAASAPCPKGRPPGPSPRLSSAGSRPRAATPSSRSPPRVRLYTRQSARKAHPGLVLRPTAAAAGGRGDANVAAAAAGQDQASASAVVRAGCGDSASSATDRSRTMSRASRVRFAPTAAPTIVVMTARSPSVAWNPEPGADECACHSPRQTDCLGPGRQVAVDPGPVGPQADRRADGEGRQELVVERHRRQRHQHDQQRR